MNNFKFKVCRFQHLPLEYTSLLLCYVIMDFKGAKIPKISTKTTYYLLYVYVFIINHFFFGYPVPKRSYRVGP